MKLSSDWPSSDAKARRSRDRTRSCHTHPSFCMPVRTEFNVHRTSEPIIAGAQQSDQRGEQIPTVQGHSQGAADASPHAMAASHEFSTVILSELLVSAERNHR